MRPRVFQRYILIVTLAIYAVNCIIILPIYMTSREFLVKIKKHLIIALTMLININTTYGNTDLKSFVNEHGPSDLRALFTALDTAGPMGPTEAKAAQTYKSTPTKTEAQWNAVYSLAERISSETNSVVSATDVMNLVSDVIEQSNPE